MLADTPLAAPSDHTVTATSNSIDNRRNARNTSGWPLLDYAGISLLILLPWWKPGYILTVDLIFGPHMHLDHTDSSANMQLLWSMLATLNVVIPSQLIEKLLLTLIFLALGLGMHRLMAPLPNGVRYLAGILGIFNPFVYDRLMYGQWTILLSFALLPWTLDCALQACSAVNRTPIKAATKLALWWSAIVGLSLPMGIIAAVMIMLTLFWSLLLSPTKRRALTQLAGVTLVVCILINLYWLVPTVVNPASAITQAAQFSTMELQAFGTQVDPVWGGLITVLGGNGFWAEQTHRMLVLRMLLPYWWLEPISLIALSVVGMRTLWSSGQSALAATMVSCLVISTVLALGNGSPFTGAISRFLFLHIVLYHGFRETQKWIALVLLAELVLAMYGFTAILHYVTRIRPSWTHWLQWTSLVAPLLFAPTLLWGCFWQIHPVEYPSSWYAANQLLSTDRGSFQTLFLPWHEYLSFPFTGRVIANPASVFFDVPIIQGDNMEMPGIPTDSINPESIALTHLFLGRPHHSQTIAHVLAQMHVKYILLAKTVDWQQYRYLSSTPGLRSEFEWRDLILYRNTLVRS